MCLECRRRRAAVQLAVRDFRGLANSQALAAASCRRPAGFHLTSSRRNNVHTNRRSIQREGPPTMLVIRMARAGSKKRPCYHIAAADSRSPRDGRFIERLGFFNPLLPKDKEDRLRLDLDKVKEWMKKGAQPSDRVMRFLDKAGVAKRTPRNNPERALPRKERKAAKEEANKAADAAKAEAKAKADAKGREE